MRLITKDDLLTAIKNGCRFDGVEFSKYWKDKQDGPDPEPIPWLKAFQPPIQQSTFELNNKTKSARKDADLITPDEFETKAEEALKRLSEGDEISTEDWPRVTQGVLFSALAEAASILKSQTDPTFGATERLKMRTGLQIYGVEIVCDKAGEDIPLDLANADFPFSLRLISCVVRMPLALSNLNLVTLDLSGSALSGVDGSFLRANGSVRMRRSFSSAPVDFGGAQVRGFFDCSEALLQPFGKLPAGQSVGGDRGMLNLSQASISNEVRLTRAVVWGGLTMRGLKTDRSIILNGAVLLSPLAVLEEMLLDGAKLENRTDVPKELAVPIAGLDDDIIKKRVEFATRKPEGRFAVYYNGDGGNLAGTSFHILLNENLNVRTSALRGDGVQVGGSIFAKGTLCRGRLRMKYAEVKGGLSLQGASLSSAELQRASFDYFIPLTLPSSPRLSALIEKRKTTYEQLVGNPGTDELAPGADDFALDLREASFGGSVRIGTLPESTSSEGQLKTRIDGIVALERATIDGALILNGVQFHWTPRVPEPTDYSKQLADIVVKRDDNVKAGRRHAIQARGIKTADSISLHRCSNLNGIELHNATIGGDLSFFEKIELSSPDKIVASYAAIGLKGSIGLEGAHISGDCKLLFDGALGPFLRAERVEVAGALIIGPNCPCKEQNFEQRLAEAHLARARLREIAANGPDEWQKEMEQRDALPLIDLGNAKAGFIEHPPAAWPKTGRLVVSGFEYRRALRFGPLAPYPFAKGQRTSKTPRELKALIAIWVSMEFLFLVTWWATRNLTAIGHSLGYLGSFLLWLVCTFAVALIGLRTWLQPNFPRNRPMAIEWLNLQVFIRNAYRTDWTVESWLLFKFLWKSPKGNILHALKPYAVAAEALREEGRWISANLVEARRLKVREKQLSWRLHFFQKLTFRGMGGVNNYGFSLTRPLLIIVGLISIGTMVAHHAALGCAITKRSEGIGITAQAVSSCSKDKLPPGFEPFIFATGMMVPAIEFGQDDDWELDKTAAPLASVKILTYHWLFAILHLASLAVFGLLIAGLSARLGLIFNRYNE